MVNPIFLKLLKLCGSTRDNVPLEDFTTEILAGILISNSYLIDHFVNDVLEVEGEGFKIDTQRIYSESCIDMVFENKSTLCFLENKVGSSENYEQLKKYASILLDNKNIYKNIYLRYCTKIKDIKLNHSYHPLKEDCFHQFRWKDIYNFLHKNYGNDNFISSFLYYLKEKNMNESDEFEIEDIISIKNTSKILRKIESHIQGITPSFEKNFGKISKIGYRQLIDSDRYAIYISPALKCDKNKWSEILLAFSLGDSPYPIISIQVFCDKNHNQYEKLNDELNIFSLELKKEEKHIFYVEESEWGLCGWFEKSLADFLTSDNQEKSINMWFNDCIDLLKIFTNKTSGLVWTLKI